MIESIEKLRDWSHRYDNSWIQRDGSIMFCTSNSQFAGDGENYGESIRSMIDEIEAEIAERYIELPVDTDGVPIRIGDAITLPNGQRDRVRYFCINANGARLNERAWVPSACRHAKPRTVEDVLAEFGGVISHYDPAVTSYDEIKPILAKYADELREMIGRGAKVVEE